MRASQSNGASPSGRCAGALDRCYKLSEVAGALKYYEMGHTQGKVAISVSGTIHLMASTSAVGSPPSIWVLYYPKQVPYYLTGDQTFKFDLIPT